MPLPAPTCEGPLEVNDPLIESLTWVIYRADYNCVTVAFAMGDKRIRKIRAAVNQHPPTYLFRYCGYTLPIRNEDNHVQILVYAVTLGSIV